MPTGLICKQFFTEREALDAIASYENNIKNGDSLEIYRIGTTGIIWIHSPNTVQDCKIKISTMKEFMVMEDDKV